MQGNPHDNHMDTLADPRHEPIPGALRNMRREDAKEVTGAIIPHAEDRQSIHGLSAFRDAIHSSTSCLYTFGKSSSRLRVYVYVYLDLAQRPRLYPSSTLSCSLEIPVSRSRRLHLRSTKLIDYDGTICESNMSGLQKRVVRTVMQIVTHMI